MNFEVRPNFKVCGKIFASDIKIFSEVLKGLTNDDIAKLENNETIKLNVNNKEYDITLDMVDIRISSKEGFNVAMENNNFIIINTTLTKDLINEGIARELISKIQNLRKEKDFEITDRINIYYGKNKEFEESIKEFISLIKNETLCIELIAKEGLDKSFDLNGIEVYLDVERI